MSGEALRLDFDRRLTLQFRGSGVTSDAGLLAYRVLDDALGLSAMAVDILADARTGKTGRHALGRCVPATFTAPTGLSAGDFGGDGKRVQVVMVFGTGSFAATCHPA